MYKKKKRKKRKPNSQSKTPKRNGNAKNEGKKEKRKEKKGRGEIKKVRGELSTPMSWHRCSAQRNELSTPMPSLRELSYRIPKSEKATPMMPRETHLATAAGCSICPAQPSPASLLHYSILRSSQVFNLSFPSKPNIMFVNLRILKSMLVDLWCLCFYWWMMN